jgi:hypothetical protein
MSNAGQRRWRPAIAKCETGWSMGWWLAGFMDDSEIDKHPINAHPRETLEVDWDWIV